MPTTGQIRKDAQGVEWRWSGSGWYAQNTVGSTKDGDRWGGAKEGPTDAAAQTPSTGATPPGTVNVGGGTADFAVSKDNPLSVAQRNLQDQVNQGLITPQQAQAELGRLRTLPVEQVSALNQQAPPIRNSPGSPLPTPFGQSGIATDQAYKTPGDIYNAQDYANQRSVSQQLETNRLNELTPFGNQYYVQDENGNQFKVNSVGNLNPINTAGWTGEQYQNQSYIDRSLQAIAGEGGDNNQGQGGLLPQLRGMFSSPVDFSGVSRAPTIDDFGADRSRIENSLYDRFATVNEPIFARQSEQFEQDMANRGIPRGSELYNQQYEQLQRAQNDARQAARAQTIQMGGSEQQRLFEDANTARTNAIGEILTKRGMPLSELQGLLSTVHPTQLPNFNATANVNVPTNDFANVADNFNTRAQQTSNLDKELSNRLETAQLGFANQLAVQGLQNAGQLNAIGLQGENSLNLGQQNISGQQQLQDSQNQFNANQGQQSPGFGSIAGNIGGAFAGAALSQLGSNLFRPSNGGGGFGSGFFSSIGNLFS